MSKRQFDLLFSVMVIGAIFLPFAKNFGIAVDPVYLTGYGAIVTYVLTQRGHWTKTEGESEEKKKKDVEA